MIQKKGAAFILSSSLVITLLYYNYQDTNIFHDDQIKWEDTNREPIYMYDGSEDFLINTTGCIIPNYEKKLKFIPIKYIKKSCGLRAIFLEKTDNNEIVFQIDTTKMGTYIKKNEKFECCYKFASRSKVNGKEDTHLSYTSCKPFKNGLKTALLQEVVTVTCTTKSKKKSITKYEDAYIFINKQKNNTEQTQDKRNKWNVLLLGMDTMSRARLSSTMPRTVAYLKKHNWLDYKGYQKVGYNTFPNLISFLTGMNLSSIYRACKPTMSDCNELMIWSKFRNSGYITAYGEDFLKLPDTFSRYNGFKSMPTHHYMRPLFLTGEQKHGNLICNKHIPSGKQILSYAYDFSNTYKNQSFFGMFWINSYSHNENNIPTLIENDILDFLEKVRGAGIMNNTFIVFLSDHGIRFGSTRLPVESYYAERLPMFFVWVPNEFQKLHQEQYYNLQLNQNRLITPYDLYETLLKISNMSAKSAGMASEACPSCNSLFEEISNERTCTEAGVSEKWCSCHGMTSINKTIDKGAENSLQLAISYVQNKTVNVQTVNCTKCHFLQLDRVLRSHSFIEEDKTYYVIAFKMNPGNIIYETTVVKDNNEFSMLNGIDTLTSYNYRGQCVNRSIDRMYCVCKKVKCS